MLKKGLILTLVAAAVVLSVGRSQAMAPTIDNPGDVYISDLEGAGSNNFNYPDAFDLLEIGSDDVVAPEEIKWSYYVAPGGHDIRINGVQPLASPDINLAVNPSDGPTTPSHFRIDDHDNDTGNPGQDGIPETVTFRNATLSPRGGPNTDPVTTGVLPLNTTVTLFASDCSTASMRSIIVYTDNDGTSDRLSGGTEPPVIIRDQDLTTDRGHWRGDSIFGNGTVSTGGGLCMTAPLAGVNNVGWVYVASTPDELNYIPLTMGDVWRMRTDVTTPGAPIPLLTAPFFDFVYKNEYFSHDETTFAITGQQTPLTYGGEFVIRDHEGGANTFRFRSPGIGRDSYDFWVSPAAMLLPQWNGTVDPTQSAFATREEARNDMSPLFRFLDLDGAGFGSEGDAGTVCVSRFRVLRYSLASIWNEDDSVIWGPPINNATHSPSTNDFVQDIGNLNSKSVINDLEAAAHYKLTGGTNFQGTRKTLIPYEPNNPANTNANLINYPIPWVTDKLYLIEFRAEAEVISGDPSTDLNPPSLIEVNGFVPTTEVVTSHVVLRGYTPAGAPDVTNLNNTMYRAGSPRLRANVGGVDQKWVGLYYTQNKTASANTDNPDRWAPRAGFYNPNTIGDDTVGLDNQKVTKFQVFDLTDAAYPDGPDSYLP